MDYVLGYSIKMNKRKISAECQMLQALEVIVEKYAVKILSFQYYKKMFGNTVIQIEKEKDIFIFMLDRGDIICNRKSFNDGLTRTIKFMAHDSYKQEPHIQLLEFINLVISQYT